jgi:hypothetical protein
MLFKEIIAAYSGNRETDKYTLQTRRRIIDSWSRWQVQLPQSFKGLTGYKPQNCWNSNIFHNLHPKAQRKANEVK